MALFISASRPSACSSRSVFDRLKARCAAFASLIFAAWFAALSNALD